MLDYGKYSLICIDDYNCIRSSKNCRNGNDDKLTGNYVADKGCESCL